MSTPSLTSDHTSIIRTPAMPTDVDSGEIRQHRNVIELVSEQAAATPEALALSAGDESLTYAQLEMRSNQLARRLCSMGVGPDEPVGLCFKRSLSFIVGALAILKAGGCYVPLDPDYPTDRLMFMLEDAAISLLVTAGELSERLGASEKRVPTIDIGSLAVTDENSDPVNRLIAGESLAYIMYTSGSTGQPKGVQITHRSLMNLVCWHQAEFDITCADRASQLASPGFDAAVWEIWPYLTMGASLHIPDETTRKNSESLRDWLVTTRISLSFIPTQLAEQMIHLEWPPHTALRFLLTGGDTLHRHPDLSLPFTVINNYGPTEATVVATSGPILPERESNLAPTIGRPISNTQIYILDEKMQPVPAGTIGEIYIGGAGIAKGYVNRPDLTAEKFVPNPFSSESNARLYKTGDLARFLVDGEIAFCGRIDGQIKLRGFRIEPDEITSALDRHPAVQGSTVGLYENPRKEKQLVAYVVFTHTAQATGRTLRDFLRSKLPEFMIPSVFVRLEAMPMLPSGKLDRNALPIPTLANTLREEWKSPNTEIECQLIGILTGLLGVDKISIDDDFFMLGGHSLLGAQLLNKIRDTFGVEITLMNLFENGTIAAMAAEIERLSTKMV